MAATVAYAGIPVVTLCDACAQAAVGAWEVGRVVAGQIREKIQAGKAKEGDTLLNAATGQKEKVARLFRMHAGKKERINSLKFNKP